MTKITTKFTALLLMLTLCFAFLASCSEDASTGGDDDNSQSEDGGSGRKPNTNYGSKIGYMATPYTLERIGSDETVNIKNYRGKVVVLNFWGIWCEPCRNELPDFDRVAAENDDVVIIAVHTYNDSDGAEGYVDANFPDSKIIFAYDIPQIGKQDMYYQMLGGEGSYPYTVILDAEGKIVAKFTGSMSHDRLLDAINSAR